MHVNTRTNIVSCCCNSNCTKEIGNSAYAECEWKLKPLPTSVRHPRHHYCCRGNKIAAATMVSIPSSSQIYLYSLRRRNRRSRFFLMASCTFVFLVTTAYHHSQLLLQEMIESQHPLWKDTHRNGYLKSSSHSETNNNNINVNMNPHHEAVDTDTQHSRIFRRATSHRNTTPEDTKDTIRYLTFGSASTYGVGLSSPRSQAYPNLLSGPVRNVSTVHGGVVLAAACTQSIVDGVEPADHGRSAHFGYTGTTTTTTSSSTTTRQPLPIYSNTVSYDVISMEFTTFTEAHRILAQRLRQRFPRATIVLIQTWSVDNIIFTYDASDDEGVDKEDVRADAVTQKSNTKPSKRHSKRKKRLTLTEWKQQQSNRQRHQAQQHDGVDDEHRVDLEYTSFHSMDLTMAMFQAGPENWSFERFGSDTRGKGKKDDQNAKIQRCMAESNAFLMTIPSPEDNDVFYFPLTLREHMTVLDEATGMYLSASGHKVVAQNLEALAESMKLKNLQGRKDSSSSSSSSDVGSWGSGDECRVWYTNGNYGDDNLLPKTLNGGRKVELGSIRDSQNMIPPLLVGHKHALEFRHGEALMVRNPFSEERMLYITYLSAEDDSYPRMRVLLNDNPTVVLDPLHYNKARSATKNRKGSDETNEHRTRTTPIGLIPPGESILRLVALDQSQLAFRLVGVSIIDESMTKFAKLEFDFEPDVISGAATHSSSWGIW